MDTTAILKEMPVGLRFAPGVLATLLALQTVIVNQIFIVILTMSAGDSFVGRPPHTQHPPFHQLMNVNNLVITITTVPMNRDSTVILTEELAGDKLVKDHTVFLGTYLIVCMDVYRISMEAPVLVLLLIVQERKKLSVSSITFPLPLVNLIWMEVTVSLLQAHH
jgi:hypothetical protein